MKLTVGVLSTAVRSDQSYLREVLVKLQLLQIAARIILATESGGKPATKSECALSHGQRAQRR